MQLPLDKQLDATAMPRRLGGIMVQLWRPWALEMQHSTGVLMQNPSPLSQVLWGRPSLSQELGGLRFDISARAFFQTNTAQAAQLTDMVVSAAGALS